MSAADATPPAARRIQAGHVRSVNPARRRMRVAVLPGCIGRLVDAPWIFLAFEDGTELRCRIETVERRGSSTEECTVVLAAGVTRDNISRARNAPVMIDCEPGFEQERMSLDWIGFKVTDSGGASLGTVVDMYWTGANSVIEIAKGGGGALLAPAIDPVIARVDVADKLVVLGDYAPYSVEEPKARR
jgi:ribosomal 30S subunit maturation factor RimM